MDVNNIDMPIITMQAVPFLKLIIESGYVWWICLIMGVIFLISIYLQLK